MIKFGKIIAVIIIIVVASIVGMAAFVHFYLTEARIKALVIPEAEKALNRKVDIGSINAGLFSGISIKDFSIKEMDGIADFVTTKAFVLNYDLLPLLKKKLLINEIRLDKPTIRIHRDAEGKFNFASLAVLSKKTATPPANATEKTATPPPLALTVKRIRINNAHLTIKDDLAELPDADINTNLLLAIDSGRDLTAFLYRGTLDFTGDTVYGKMKSHIEGKSDFDQKQATLTADVKLDKERIHLGGTIGNFTAGPDIALDITSKALNIDYLLDMIAGLPKAPPRQKAPGNEAKDGAPAEPIGAMLPAGLAAHGLVKIDKANYKAVDVRNFLLNYTLDKGIFTIKDMTADTTGGQINGAAEVNLNNAGPAYQGSIKAQSIEAGRLMPVFTRQAADIISGVLETSFTFTGAGTEWQKIKQTLTAEGAFALRNGQIRKTAVSSAIANLLNLPELRALTYEDITGTVGIRHGKAALAGKINSQAVKVQTDGTVGLGGKLDLPLTLRLSPQLSRKLKSRATFTKYLTDEQGETVLRLKLAGTLDNPRPALDTAGVKEQLKTTIKGKAMEKLGGILSGRKAENNKKGKDAQKESPAKNFLKGLLNK